MENVTLKLKEFTKLFTFLSLFAFNTPLIYYVYQLLTLSFTHLKDIFPFCRTYAFAHISSLFVARKLHYCRATTNFLHFFFAVLTIFYILPHPALAIA